MFILKIADKKLSKLGFIKVKENELATLYKRSNKKYNCTQILTIWHAQNEENTLHSCDSKDGRYIELTESEVKLCLRKMKEMKGNEGNK